jgi:lysylphosphatidylglycerol synthetase-like protein (DUF2156 family)
MVDRMKHLNRWSATCVWVAAMVVAWFTLVPSVLSASSLAVAAVAGPIFIVSGATLWETSRPTPSFRQSQAEAEVANPAGRRR